MARTNTASNTKCAAKTPQFLVEKKFYNEPAALENAKLVQTFLPWIALENFRDGSATGADWSMIQYWLYYAEALISLYSTEEPDDRPELAGNVGYGIKSLYAAGQRYNKSKYTVMTMTPAECESIRLSLLIGDTLKDITEERILLVVGRHVQKVLNIPQK